jgi:hypothetical protein
MVQGISCEVSGVENEGEEAGGGFPSQPADVAPRSVPLPMPGNPVRTNRRNSIPKPGTLFTGALFQPQNHPKQVIAFHADRLVKITLFIDLVANRKFDGASKRVLRHRKNFHAFGLQILSHS